MEKPVNIDLRGTTISELTDFRFDAMANEHQFFQLTFNRASLQNDFDLSALESFYNTPVRLNFLTQTGKLRQVTGNIITLKCLDRAGHAPEVTIAGTFYSPAGKFPKLDRFIWGAIVLPLLLMGSVFLYVHQLKDKLVEKIDKRIDVTKRQTQAVLDFKKIPGLKHNELFDAKKLNKGHH